MVDAKSKLAAIKVLELSESYGLGTAAIGHAGIIGPFFFEGNVDWKSYSKIIEEEFYPVFSNLPNSPNLIFMQDGAPPHREKNVR